MADSVRRSATPSGFCSLDRTWVGVLHTQDTHTHQHTQDTHKTHTHDTDIGRGGTDRMCVSEREGQRCENA